MNKWQKSILSLTIAVSLLSAGTPAAAAAQSTAAAKPSVHIYIDGKHQDEVLFYQSRSYIPLTAFEDKNRVKYGYDAKSGTIVIWRTVSGTKIQLKPGSKQAVVNGKKVSLDLPVLTIKGRTFVPLQFLTRFLGAELEYGERSNEVILRTTNGQNNYNLLRVGHLADARSVAVGLPLVYENGQLVSKADGTLVTYTFPEGEALRYIVEHKGLKQYVVVGRDGIARVKWQKDTFSTNELGTAPADFGPSYYYSYDVREPDKITYGNTSSSISGQKNDMDTYYVGEDNFKMGLIFEKIPQEERKDGIADE